MRLGLLSPFKPNLSDFKEFRGTIFFSNSLKTAFIGILEQNAELFGAGPNE